LYDARADYNSQSVSCAVPPGSQLEANSLLLFYIEDHSNFINYRKVAILKTSPLRIEWRRCE